MPNLLSQTARIDWRQFPIHTGILLTLALVPVWYRLPGAPPPFTSDYVTGFAISVPLLWTVFWWFALGLPGFNTLRKDRLRALWATSLLLVVLWMFLSGSWAYMGEIRPGLATGAALQFGLAALFVLCVACASPPPVWILVTLVASMLAHGLIGGLQVSQQASLGLEALGELVLDPQKSGVSVIQAGTTRWLRPYGLTSHPNVLAGFLVTGLLSASPFVVSTRKHVRWLGTGAFLLGLWVLFLSFSRGAWLGLVVGGLIMLILVYPQLWARVVRRHLLLTLVVVMCMALAFFVRYRPLLLARVGAGHEQTEMRSVNERIELAKVAQVAIEEHPLQGVGAGNFPWFASYYFFYETDLDMRGDNVHNVWLSVWAELGIVGLGLVITTLGLGVKVALLHAGTKADRIQGYALLSGFAALVMIGVFDHYPWTMIHFQTLWWSLLASAGSAQL